ncbi:APC family permease [bacterium]|nr:APC family permease [bacterium]
MPTKLKRSLGLLEVFCISSGAMISSGIFVLISLAYLKTGPAVMVAYALASLLMIPSILAKVELVTAMPETGGIFLFVDRSMGPLMGTLAGFAAWFSLAFKTAFALIGMGIFLSLLNPGTTILQTKIIAIVCCIIFTLINLRGIKISGRFQVVTVAILFALLLGYFFFGIFFINTTYFVPFNPFGFKNIFATAGMVFISFAGTTKLAAIAGEVKNPEKTLPWGMFLSWGIVSLFYLLVIGVTVGICPPLKLASSLTPLSLGGNILLGRLGLIIMTFAGLLAFITTGNAGILTTSRNPMAMSTADLLPSFFRKISRRGVPIYSIIFTSLFMITIILFLELETFVKTASTLQLILFILANASLIFIRQRKLLHYYANFKSPFYPWIHIIGILAYVFLIFEMGTVPILTALLFISLSLIWYFVYAQPKVKAHYNLIKILKKTGAVKTADPLLDEGIRENMIARDLETEKIFEEKIKNCLCFNFNKNLAPWEICKNIAKPLAKRLEVKEAAIYKKLIQKREIKTDIIKQRNIKLIYFHVHAHNKSEIVLVKTNPAKIFANKKDKFNATFIVVCTSEEQNFYLHAILWFVQIAQSKNFLKKWQEVKTNSQMRELFLGTWKKRRPQV